MLTYPEALEQIRSLVKPLPLEHVPLTQALNRILARPIFADRDYPPFNRVAMDGIAIRIADWQRGTREFQIQDTLFAGMETANRLAVGACYKIMTGAACPSDADTVIRKEDIHYTAHGTALIHLTTLAAGQHIAKQAEDLQQNALAISAPRVCDSTLMGALAALGIQQVPVYQMPSVAIVTTGNEVVPVDQRPARFQIRNSNQQLLRALCATWQLPIRSCQHAADEPEALKTAIQQAIHQQLILINGGVSAGEADYVPQILGELGITVQLHKVAIKPGKPLLVGTLPEGKLIFALPGNPLSCFTTFKLFVEEYLHRAVGFTHERFQMGKLQHSRSKKTTLDEFFPVFRQPDTTGYNWKPHHGSGDITATVGCAGIGWHRHDQQLVPENDHIPILPLHPFLPII